MVQVVNKIDKDTWLKSVQIGMHFANNTDIYVVSGLTRLDLWLVNIASGYQADLGNIANYTVGQVMEMSNGKLRFIEISKITVD